VKYPVVKLMTAAMISAASLSAMASSNLLTGPQLTLGNVSSAQTLLSINSNPAAAQLVLNKKKSFRWSYVSGFALGVEFADIDNVLDEYNLLSDELDDIESFGGATEDDIVDIADQFNGFLTGLGDEPVLMFDAEVHAPGFPLVFRSELLKGVVSLDVLGSVSAGGRIIGDSIEAQLGDGGDFEASTNTALSVFYGTFASATLGYSHDFGNPFSALDDAQKLHLDRLKGRLLVGGSLNVYKATIAAQLEGLVVESDGDDDDDEAIDSILDISEANEADSTSIGLDLGVLWVAEHYQLGMTWRNINEPEFDFPDPSSNCAVRTGSDLANCELAMALETSRGIEFRDTFTMASQISVEAAMTSSNKHWVLASGFDLNEVESLSGNESQWLSASASYYSDSYWVPSARLGYRKNLVGSELSLAGVGLTLFGGVTLDLAVALESIDIGGDEDDEGELDEGDSVPRAAYLSLGFEHKF